MFAACLVAVSGCASTTPSEAASADPPTTEAPVLQGDPASALAAVLDPSARDLLSVIDPHESVQATMTVAQPEAVAQAAIARGLAADVISIDSVEVRGPVKAVLAFAAESRPTLVYLLSDQRVDRWLPDAFPTPVIGVPGAPYLHASLGGDRSRLQMSVDLQGQLVRKLAGSIVTYDGQPYDRIEMYGDCGGGPASCSISASGWLTLSGGVEDHYDVILDTGVVDAPQLVSSIQQSVPRSVARAAEWIARHDAKAAAALARYTTCCGASWDASQPAQIALSYVRPCARSVAPTGLRLASTGDCFESLRILVDVRAMKVLSLEERPVP